MTEIKTSTDQKVKRIVQWSGGYENAAVLINCSLMSVRQWESRGTTPIKAFKTKIDEIYGDYVARLAKEKKA